MDLVMRWVVSWDAVRGRGGVFKIATVLSLLSYSYGCFFSFSFCFVRRSFDSGFFGGFSLTVEFFEFCIRFPVEQSCPNAMQKSCPQLTFLTRLSAKSGTNSGISWKYLSLLVPSCPKLLEIPHVYVSPVSSTSAETVGPTEI